MPDDVQPLSAVERVAPRLRAGRERMGWIPVLAVDEHGCLLHTEPVCLVPAKWHPWFIEWLERQDVPVLYPTLLYHPMARASDVSDA